MRKSYKRKYQDQAAAVLPEAVEEAAPVDAVGPGVEIPFPAEVVERVLSQPISHGRTVTVTIPPVASHQDAFLNRVNQRIGKATVCPRCNASGFWVARTAPTDDGQFRERHCDKCGFIQHAIQPPEKAIQ